MRDSILLLIKMVELRTRLENDISSGEYADWFTENMKKEAETLTKNIEQITDMLDEVTE